MRGFVRKMARAIASSGCATLPPSRTSTAPASASTFAGEGQLNTALRARWRRTRGITCARLWYMGGAAQPPNDMATREIQMLFVVAFILTLVVGDLASTFFYHVPQHLWFTLHLRTHHDRRRSYLDHAVISKDPAVLLDGFLGALPYLVVAASAARVSLPGALAGLLFGQLHVWWRHTTDL